MCVQQIQHVHRVSAVRTTAVFRFSFTVKHAFLPLYLAEVPPRHRRLYSPFMWHYYIVQVWHPTIQLFDNSAGIDTGTIEAISNPNSAGIGIIRNDVGVLNSAGLLGWHMPALFGAHHHCCIVRRNIENLTEI